jgi:hypothetical protein
MGRKNPLSTYTDEEIFKEAGRRQRARVKSPPRAKVMRLCPKGCGKQFGAREMRVHTPKCKGKGE